MDRHAAMMAETDAPFLRLKPSEYFQRQCVIGAEGEERELPMVVELLGDDNIVFSTDYPHSDSDFPHAVDEFFEMPLSDTTRRKILWDNCARFYRIDDQPVPAAVAASQVGAAVVADQG
jgi:predicted TIM-barrel fold metal-dependent hydrolase